MSGHSNTLSARQLAAVAALVTEPTPTQVAQQARDSEDTLQRRLHLPVFVAAYRPARREVMDRVIGGLQRAAGKALETLERNLTCGRPGDEIRAALGILDGAGR